MCRNPINDESTQQLNRPGMPGGFEARARAGLRSPEGRDPPAHGYRAHPAQTHPGACSTAGDVRAGRTRRRVARVFHSFMVVGGGRRPVPTKIEIFSQYVIVPGTAYFVI